MGYVILYATGSQPPVPEIYFFNSQNACQTIKQKQKQAERVPYKVLVTFHVFTRTNGDKTATYTGCMKYELSLDKEYIGVVIKDFKQNENEVTPKN